MRAVFAPRWPALAFVWLAVAVSGEARAQDAPAPRVIAPERFAPNYRDPPPASTAPAAPVNAPARTPVVAPTRDNPLGNCARDARDWLYCLQATARLADDLLAAAEAKVVDSLETRPRLNAFMKESIAKKLKVLEDDWRALRDRECEDLAQIERGIEGQLYEARQMCRIRRNLERADALAARYIAAP